MKIERDHKFLHPKGDVHLKIVTVSKDLVSPMALPGMGRSVDIAGLDPKEVIELRAAFSKGQLYIEYSEEPGDLKKVINLWANPHAPQMTLFIA